MIAGWNSDKVRTILFFLLLQSRDSAYDIFTQICQKSLL